MRAHEDEPLVEAETCRLRYAGSASGSRRHASTESGMCSDPGMTPSRRRSSLDRVSIRSAPSRCAARASLRLEPVEPTPRVAEQVVDRRSAGRSSVTLVAAILARAAQHDVMSGHAYPRRLRRARSRSRGWDPRTARPSRSRRTRGGGDGHHRREPARIARRHRRGLPAARGRARPCPRARDTRSRCRRECPSTDTIVDLLRREAAVLSAEQLDDEPPRSAASPAQSRASARAQFRPAGHSDNDTRSQRRATVALVRERCSSLRLPLRRGAGERRTRVPPPSSPASTRSPGRPSGSPARRDGS